MTRDKLVERALAGANHLRWLISKHQHETLVPEIREACAEWSKQAAAIEALAALPPEPVGLPVVGTCSDCSHYSHVMGLHADSGRCALRGRSAPWPAAKPPAWCPLRAKAATLGDDAVARAEREVVEAAVRFYRHEVRTAAELDSTTAALLDARAKAEQTKGTK